MKTIEGSLVSQGIRVQRARLRNCLKRVDPIGRRLRSITTIRRRVYNVRSPLALWHMDGNHKLIRLVYGSYFMRHYEKYSITFALYILYQC